MVRSCRFGALGNQILDFLLRQYITGFDRSLAGDHVQEFVEQIPTFGSVARGCKLRGERLQ
jgi:hypothetical protein